MRFLRASVWFATLGMVAQPAFAADDQCRIVDVSFTPAAIVNQTPVQVASQMVVWVEKADGTYVDTLFITAATGTYGIGNRPGRFDFNSGPDWPYGRRITTFPVWAHRNLQHFAQVMFQDDYEDGLSHSTTLCSDEHTFCRPMFDGAGEQAQWDAQTCPSATVYTDKGKLSPTLKTGYPPRVDVTRTVGRDTPEVATYPSLNPYDAVSKATPPEGSPANVAWTVPNTLEQGDYVLWAEVSREFDQNATYSVDAYPSPVGIPYGDYGEPYRGQPSVLYKVPFTVGTTDTTTLTLDYAGYGDPDGLDGDVRAPDTTISTGVAGSGAERLAVAADGGTPYRLKVTAHTKPDASPPGMAGGLEAMGVTTEAATIQFVAPGEDGETGTAASYDIRYRVGEAITEANFADSTPIVADAPLPAIAGTIQSFPLKGLLFDTDYSVAIRATDDCSKAGPLAIVTFHTDEREQGEVDACFIATAAYGTAMAPDVAMLRNFRDRMLKDTVLGQLAVSSYYTFGPAVAGAIGESEPLRAAARTLLSPIVNRVRGFLL